MLKNPFNYTGAKYRLLPQILPLFPNDIHTFVDLFGGGGEMTVNVQATQHIYNDKCYQLVNIFQNLDENFISDVEGIISEYNLSKYNKQGFLNLREHYNKNLHKFSSRDNAIILYCLLAHSFNNQIGFNSKGGGV